MKVKDLSLLIVDDDQIMRQLLAALVSDRYRSVTAAAPDEVGGLIVSESFDMMISPRFGVDFYTGDAGDSRVGEDVTPVAAIKSGVTGKIYHFRSLNQAASSWVISPFEQVLLQVAIENAESSLRRLKRITEHDANF